MRDQALAATTQATVGVITRHTTGCACDTCDQLRYVRLPDAVETLVAEAAEAARLRSALRAADANLRARAEQVSRVEAAHDGLEHWRANAEHYGDDVAEADSTAQQKAYARALAYQRAIQMIRRALDGIDE